MLLDKLDLRGVARICGIIELGHQLGRLSANRSGTGFKVSTNVPGLMNEGLHIRGLIGRVRRHDQNGCWPWFRNWMLIDGLVGKDK